MNLSSYRLIPGLVLLLSFQLIAAASDLQKDAKYKGMKLEQALRKLQTRGLNIVFSSDLVRPEMRVQREPSRGSPYQLLQELLSPFDLKFELAPGNTLLVVQGRVTDFVEPKSQPPAEKVLEEVVDEYILVPFVRVYLTAQDPYNRFVTGLRETQLTLLEDGKERPILELVNFTWPEFASQSDPLTVFFLVDSSNSMKKVFADAKRHNLFREAASGLLQDFQPHDRLGVVAFNERSWTISDLTNDRDLIRNRLHNFTVTGGKTAMFDTLAETIRQIEPFEGRKIIVVCSDGEDNSSEISWGELVRILRSSNVTVVSLGIFSSSESREVLQKIAEVTGGTAFFPETIPEVRSQLNAAINAIRSQYVVGYVPIDPSVHRWRHLEILCRIPGIRLHYRKAFLF